MPALAQRQGQSLSPAHQWFTNHLPELTSRAHALFSRLPYVEREDAVPKSSPSSSSTPCGPASGASWTA